MTILQRVIFNQDVLRSCTILLAAMKLQSKCTKRIAITPTSVLKISNPTLRPRAGQFFRRRRPHPLASAPSVKRYSPRQRPWVPPVAEANARGCVPTSSLLRNPPSARFCTQRVCLMRSKRCQRSRVWDRPLAFRALSAPVSTLWLTFELSGVDMRVASPSMDDGPLHSRALGSRA